MEHETFEAAEAECRSAGFAPFRLVFVHEHRGRVAVGQVQSVETGGAATFGHSMFCSTVVPVTVPTPAGFTADVREAAWLELAAG